MAVYKRNWNDPPPCYNGCGVPDEDNGATGLDCVWLCSTCGNHYDAEDFVGWYSNRDGYEHGPFETLDEATQEDDKC